jgi:ribosome recycling factor
MKLSTNEFEVKMKKSIEAYKNELDSVRAGRANPNVLSRITGAFASINTNIENMANGSKGDFAYTIIETNSPLAHVVDDLKAVDGAIKVIVL